MVRTARQVKPDSAEAKPSPGPAKERKAKTKSSIQHPPYLQMVMEAISSLKERTGSSQHAIAKYLQEKYKSGLPAAFKRILSLQLKLMSKNGKITQVKHSFKLPPNSKKIKAGPEEVKVVSKPAPKVAKAPSKSSPVKEKVKPVSKVRVAPVGRRVKSSASEKSSTRGRPKGAIAEKKKVSSTRKPAAAAVGSKRKASSLKSGSRPVRSSTRSRSGAPGAGAASPAAKKKVTPKKAMPAVKRARRAAAAK